MAEWLTHWTIYYAGLTAIIFLSLAGWVLSLTRDNVNHVSCIWSLSIGMSAFCYTLFFYELHARALLVLILVSIWAIRHALYLAWRDVHRDEDFRFATMRKSQGSFFWMTSLISLFAPLSLFAWLVSMPIFFAIENNSPLSMIDYYGIVLVLIGIITETIADFQLAQFKQEKPHQLLQNGVWQYCRHPNYLGEMCVWIGFFCIAMSAMAWISIISPVLVLLLIYKWHGIPLIEKQLQKKYPEYKSYKLNTPALIPNVVKK
jgi:steroid 5-alpha reductase family enzyme